jgi:Na+/H+-dicarboxylate symporter
MAQGQDVNKLGIRILIALIAGLAVGLVLRNVSDVAWVKNGILFGGLDVIGKWFIEALKMLVVPIVFFSLSTAILNLKSGRQLGRIGVKAIILYLLTTAIAITLGLIFASLFHVGAHQSAANIVAKTVTINQPQSFKDVLIHIIPSNPIHAMAKSNMLQIIFFALFVGFGLSTLKHKGLNDMFNALNDLFIQLIHFILWVAPIGVFCLIAKIFATLGFSVIMQLLGYFFTVILVLLIQVVVTYSVLLMTVARTNPFNFFRQCFSLMLFAFSTSSSNATLPVTLETAIEKLKVPKSVAAFVIPLGATINMDGTAIMQGIATVFIANLYNIHLGITQYIMVILTATLASIGTAGVPGVGLITLTIVLKQVGLPVEGIALIIGVDRLLDMLRTAVNVTGDTMVAFLIGKTEK